MSKSVKKSAVVKVGGWIKDIYWSIVRSRNKQRVNAGKDPLDEAEIVNDYNYVDYRSYCTEYDDCYCIRKYGYQKCKNK